MKRIIISMLIASALIGCQEQIEELNSASKAEVFEAYIEEFTTATKTSLTQTNNVVWSENDHVAIFQGSSIADKYKVVSSSVGSTNGKFTIEADNSGEVNGDFVSGNEFPTNVALYPYADNLSCSNGQLNEDNVASYVIDGFVLPQIQNYTEKSFGEEAFPMVAVTNGLADHTLRFKNVCGAMKLQFKGTDAIQSITVEGRNGEKLSGSATLTIYPTNAAPVIELSQNATTSVTLDCGEGVQLNEETATSFIISLPPISFTQGFKVTVTKTNGETKNIETSSANTVFRSSILVMPGLTIEASETGDDNTGEVPNLIDYVDEYGINHGPGIVIDGVVWAPVNCGYHATDYQWGKLYQWGRKYGQGYIGDEYKNGTYVECNEGGSVNIVRNSVSLNVGQDVANKNNIYLPDSSDWTSESSNKLWNSGSESEPIKTEYDPCPSGWRIPTYTETKSLGKSVMSTNENGQRGYYFSGSKEYAEADAHLFLSFGGRWTYFGYADDRGNIGYYWTSKAATDLQAYYILLYSDYILWDDNIRMYGCSVRCVQDNSVSDTPTEPETPAEPDPSQPSYSLQLNPSTYGWVKSSSVANPDSSLFDGVYESTNQGKDNTKSLMYIDINGYEEFTIYVRSYAESSYDYVEVSNLDADITGSNTSNIKISTKSNQQSGTSLSSYTKVTFTNIGGGQHRIMVTYRKDSSQSKGNDKGYVLIPKDQTIGSPDTPSDSQLIDYVDEYGVNQGKGVEIDGVVWAPVNCGYHATNYKWGKLYQWGRKYGQGYSGVLYDVNGDSLGQTDDATGISISSTGASEADGNNETNAKVFYLSGPTVDYDWAVSQNNKLWNAGTEDNPIKTEYDPCPVGWRVPTYAELYELIHHNSSWTTNESDQAGYWFSGSTTYSTEVPQVFLPAAGFRDGSNCATSFRGLRGYYWSSMPSSRYAYIFYFYEDLTKSGYDGRAHGLSVRCVQE